MLKRLSDALGLHVFEQHQSIATPHVAVSHGEDGTVRVALDGELSFSGEGDASALRNVELPASSAPLLVDLAPA